MAHSGGGNHFYERLEAGFARRRDAPLLETPQGRRFRYRDAIDASASYAHLLRASGLRKGDRLLAQVEKSPEVVLLYLACLRAGVVFVPLNVAYTTEEVRFFARDAAPSAAVSAPPALATMQGLGAAPVVFTLDASGGGTLVEGARAYGAPFANAPAGVDDVAAILYTSGTTGHPKGAMITHGNLASNGEALRRLWGFDRGDVLLHVLPVFHAHGLFTALHCVLLSGSRMIFAPRFDTATVCRLLARATVMMGVPTLYERLLAEPAFTAEACAGVRLFTCGSAPLARQTAERFCRRTGHRLLERYGTTEAMIVTSNPLAGERRAGSVGRPLPGVEVRVADAADRVVSAGVAGRVQCRGPNVFKGYWRRPEASAEAFTADGFFVTGDLGSVDADGYLALVGRESDMIISGGYNVYPREVETVLEAMAGVAASAVFGVPHPDFGEGVAAAVEPHPQARELSEQGIIALAKSRLAGYKVPKRVLFVDELPRNPMGKVQKSVLRERYRALFTKGVGPRSPAGTRGASGNGL